MSNVIRFIGDIHGDWETYRRDLISCDHKTLQVGDYGIFPYATGNFLKVNEDGDFYYSHEPEHQDETKPIKWFYRIDHQYVKSLSTDNEKDRFIRGNHDDPFSIKLIPGYVDDGSLVFDSIFCVGGASSIDKAFRREGVDWWRDEELSYSESLIVLQKYLKTKPDIVVSHDCPDFLTYIICPNMTRDGASSTRTLLSRMFEMYKPKLWVHGHWHISARNIIDGCEFISLGINEIFDFDVDTLK